MQKFLGFSFLELSSVNQDPLSTFLRKMGFSLKATDSSEFISFYQQGQSRLITNHHPEGFAQLSAEHRCCYTITGIGFQVRDIATALRHLLDKGADELAQNPYNLQGVWGPSRIPLYLLDSVEERRLFEEFFYCLKKDSTQETGLTVIDHITINFPLGELQSVIDFFQDVFGFQLIYDYPLHLDRLLSKPTSGREFEGGSEHRTGVYIEVHEDSSTEPTYKLPAEAGFGKKSNKIQYRSSLITNENHSICFVMNEMIDDFSTVAEFIKVHKGAGIQRIAFQTNDIIKTIQELKKNQITFLPIPEHYADKSLRDDKQQLKSREKIQIRTKIYPLFFEIIGFRKDSILPQFLEASYPCDTMD